MVPECAFFYKTINPRLHRHLSDHYAIRTKLRADFALRWTPSKSNSNGSFVGTPVSTPPASPLPSSSDLLDTYTSRQSDPTLLPTSSPLRHSLRIATPLSFLVMVILVLLTNADGFPREVAVQV